MFRGLHASLTVLCFSGEQITDEGIRQFKAPPHLEVLDLTGTEVTNNAIDHLADIRTLRLIVVDNTAIDKHKLTERLGFVGESDSESLNEADSHPIVIE